MRRRLKAEEKDKVEVEAKVKENRWVEKEDRKKDELFSVFDKDLYRNDGAKVLAYRALFIIGRN